MTILERPPVDWERHRGDKRPKILPPPGETWRNPSTGRKVGHRYYTRVTTYADAITEAYNLTAWKLRRVALGLGQRADYVRLAAAYTDEDRDRDALDELVGKALEAAGPNRADLGTALHSLTERVDRGEDLGTPPEEVLPDLAAYTAITEGTLTMLLREPRTVCDLLECAGTPDTIAVVAEAPPTGDGLPVCDCPSTRARVVDTKTGSVRYPGKMSTQLSIYSRSDLYDPETGERTPLDVCPHWGVIVHLPVETGEAALFWLDLEHGWRGAELCGPVREWHKAKADDILRPFATVKPVKVVDGEVTRIEPRLASVNLNAPAPLEPIADITEQLAASLAARGEPVAGLDAAERDDQGDEAALHEDLAAELEATRRPGIPSPGPDRCAHSGGLTISGSGKGLVCRDCGEPAGFGPTRPATVDDDTEEPDAGPTEIDTEEVTEAETELPDAGEFDGSYLDAIADAEELASGPDSDAEDEPALDNPVAEAAADPYEAVESLLDPERSVAVDDALRDRDDPAVDEILGCVTTRDLELLGTTRWRWWTQAHKDLAAERHRTLEAAEAAAKPRAATEAAINAAETVEALTEVMLAVRDEPHMTPELFALADARYWSLKGARGRELAGR